MIYSRKIEVCKCQYAHFAHIRLSFGCTDEKMDFGTYLDTYGRISKTMTFEHTLSRSKYTHHQHYIFLTFGFFFLLETDPLGSMVWNTILLLDMICHLWE